MWLTYGHLKVVLELLHVIDIDCCGHIIYWGDEYLHKPQGFQVWRVKPWILFIGVICILYSLSYEKEVFFTVCVFTLCSWGFPSLSIKIITCQKKKNFLGSILIVWIGITDHWIMSKELGELVDSSLLELVWK